MSCRFAVKQDVATTTALTASATSSVYGQATTFTATVTTNSGVPVTAGTVSFLDGATVLATGLSLNMAGQASLTRTLPAGQHTIRAVYGGVRTFHDLSDPNFMASHTEALYPSVFPYLT